VINENSIRLERSNYPFTENSLGALKDEGRYEDMTTQILDEFEYKNKCYSLVSADGDSLFSPEQFGIEPVSWHTACYRGYFCTYKLQHNKLCLKTFDISLTEPSSGETKIVKKVFAPKIEGCMPIKLSKDTYRYVNINLPINFTGFLLLGGDWMGMPRRVLEYLHRDLAYRDVYKLIFQSGVLVESNNISTEVAEKRLAVINEASNTKLFSRRNIRDIVN
jgi:hypothetical protein